MKAMVFAAGLGTRLRPYTEHMPKALVPVAGVPMLQRVLLRLKSFGFTEVVVNIHHFGEQIIDFLKANNNFGMNISISDERGELLDTGGGILKARTFLDGNEPFLVHNADILSDINLADIYLNHLNNDAEATLLVSKRDTSRYLLFNENLYLSGWINKATGEIKPAGLDYTPYSFNELAFGGIHVISPSIYHYMEKQQCAGKFSITPFYLSICKEAKIKGYIAKDARWFDIGKPETLALAEKSFQ